MLGSLLFLTLQAATTQPAALATADAPGQQSSAETATAPAEATPAEPPRKKVCRTVVDTRTGIMGKRSKVCRFVDEPSAN